jgi:hypothetical protein
LRNRVDWVVSRIEASRHVELDHDFSGPWCDSLEVVLTSFNLPKTSIGYLAMQASMPFDPLRNAFVHRLPVRLSTRIDLLMERELEARFSELRIVLLRFILTDRPN